MNVELVWEGKAEAAALGVPGEPRALPEGNVLIRADNLTALRALPGGFNLIYIDPPYNTGGTFSYEDSYGGHAGWLSMMYPRLLLAKHLLADAASLLISLDDHEIDTCTRLCKEIFGDENVEILVWNTEAEGSSGTLKRVRTVRSSHEYVLACHLPGAQWNRVPEPLPGAKFTTANLAVNRDRENHTHPNYFTLSGPHGDTFSRQWKWDAQHIARLEAEGLLWWGRDGKRQPRLIIPTDERRRAYLRSILNYGGTTVGRKDFEAVMGTDIEFSYPKPLVLLEKLILATTQPGDRVLDFFAGSGSTGVAAASVDRRFVLVQEPTEAGPQAQAAGMPTLADITAERLRRSKIEFNALTWA